MEFPHQRGAVAAFMRRLYRQKLTSTSGGNISLRIDPGHIAITPAGIDKGRMKPEQVRIVTPEGENLTPGAGDGRVPLAPSSETRMHLRIYAECPWVEAIVHAHPVTATAFSATATPIRVDLLSELYALLGNVVVAEYGLTTSEELAGYVAAAARASNCILMKNHGVVALGRTLLEAFDRLELIEIAAQSTLIARQLEGVTPMTPAQLGELDRLMKR